MKKIILSVLFIFCAFSAVRSETGVFPYAEAASSAGLPENSGMEYARMLTVVLSLSTDIETVSMREIMSEGGQLGLSPSGTLTGEDLNRLAERISADRILTGTVSRSGGKFLSSSILYSVKDGCALRHFSAAAGSLEELAVKEIREYFPLDMTETSSYTERKTDTVFLTDCSFSVSGDWESVKQGILSAGEKLFSGGRNSSRICLVPFGGKTEGPAVKADVCSSSAELKKNLASIRPSGAYSDSSFRKALEYAVKSFLWRKDAEKKIIIITDSVIGRKAAAGCGIKAARAGIKTDSVLLGKLNFEDAAVPEELSGQTGGTVRYTAYHKKIFDVNGKSRELYLQQGRLFCSREAVDWQKGILSRTPERTGFMPADEGLSELLSGTVSPESGTMGRCWTEVTGERSVNSRKTENNAAALICSCIPADAGTAAGRILVTDGELSVWADLAAPEDTEFFQKKKESGEFLELGVTVCSDASSPYGITPVCVSRGLNAEDIPSACSVRIKDLIKKKDESGLMTPAVWFLRVKIQEVRADVQSMDIRDSLN